MSKKKTVKEKMVEDKPLSFIKGTISDGILNYSYAIKKGNGSGATHAVKGQGLFEDDLAVAFSKLNVHLAVIDDTFKHAEVEIKNIDKMRSHELALLYQVDSFSIQGEEDDLSVIITGSKRINSATNWMDIKTPKIPLVKHSSYEWWMELMDVLDEVREEVELYHEGKYTPIEKEEKKDESQLTIEDEMTEEEFESGRA